MYSTAHKISTKRTAVAEASLLAPHEALVLLREKRLPKGDALEVSRAAALLAAKRCSELIPHCHPLPIDHIGIDFEFGERAVRIVAEVTTIGKTGVEIEALMAVQIAALNLYDMMKPLNVAMEITDVRLVDKRGGKSDFQEKIPHNFKAAVIVTSDGTAAGLRVDKSGKIICEALLRFTTAVEYIVVPDELAVIEDLLRTFVAQDYHLIITTGGTGLGPRDVTVEATQRVIEREIPGIMEAARGYGQQRTPYAMLSRGLAGVAGNSIMVNLPGSSNGTRESLEAIFPAILHAFPMMGGGGHESKRSEA